MSYIRQNAKFFKDWFVESTLEFFMGAWAKLLMAPDIFLKTAMLLRK